MEWVLLVVVVGVLAVGAVAASGRLGAMPEEPVRDIPVPVLPEGGWRGADVRATRFATAPRGYRMSQVDEVLDRLAGELDGRDARIAALQDELAARPADPDPSATRDPAPAPGPDPDQPWR